MLDKDFYRVTSLQLFGKDDLYFSFLGFTKLSIIRSHILSYDQDFIRRLTRIANDAMRDAEKNTGQTQIVYKNFVSSLVLLTVILDFYDQIGYDHQPTLDQYKKINKIIQSCALDTLENHLDDQDISNEVYLLSYLCLQQLQSVYGFSDQEGGELNDYFRLFVYLPILYLQTERHRIFFGRHSKTGKLLSTSIKFASTTRKFYEQSPVFQKSWSSLLKNANLDDQQFAESNMGYFYFPLSIIFSTCDETDEHLLPSIWQHSALIERRSFPKTKKDLYTLYEDIRKERRFLVPIDGVEVFCKGFGDIKKVFIKEKNYRGLDPDYFQNRVIFFKVTFDDGLEDLVALSVDTNGILISAFHDIYDSSVFDIPDVYSSLLMKIYYDFVCTKATEKVQDHKRGKLGYVYRKPQEQTETVVYLPRSVVDVRDVRDRDDVTDRNTTSGLVRAPHFVNQHLRKLPSGYHASHQAIELAKKFGYHLPQGYTFVSPFETGKPMANKTVVQRENKLEAKKKKKVYISKFRD